VALISWPSGRSAPLLYSRADQPESHEIKGSQGAVRERVYLSRIKQGKLKLPVHVASLSKLFLI
jgi:hypothetical protein